MGKPIIERTFATWEHAVAYAAHASGRTAQQIADLPTTPAAPLATGAQVPAYDARHDAPAKARSCRDCGECARCAREHATADRLYV